MKISDSSRLIYTNRCRPLCPSALGLIADFLAFDVRPARRKRSLGAVLVGTEGRSARMNEVGTEEGEYAATDLRALGDRSVHGNREISI